MDQENENNKPIPQKRLTRRGFLATIAGESLLFSKLISSAPTPEPTATSTPKPTDTPEPTATSTPEPTKTPESRPTEVKQTIEKQIEDFIFRPHFTEAEKAAASRQIQKWLEYYKSQTGFENVKSRVNSYQNLILSVSNKLEPKLKTDLRPWVNILKGLILVESAGNPSADNGIAQGLCQLKEDGAKEAAKLVGWTQYNLKDPEDNITLGTTLLVGKYNNMLFPDPSVSLLAYNMGEGNISRLIYDYSGRPTKVPFYTAEYTRSNKLNVVKLLPTESKNAEYVYKVIAATLALSNFPNS